MNTRTRVERNLKTVHYLDLSPDGRRRADAMRGLCLASAALEHPINGGPVSAKALAERHLCSPDMVRRLIGLAIHFGWLVEQQPPSGPREGQFGARPWLLAVTPEGQRELAKAAGSAQDMARAWAAEAARLEVALLGLGAGR